MAEAEEVAEAVAEAAAEATAEAAAEEAVAVAEAAEAAEVRMEGLVERWECLARADTRVVVGVAAGVQAEAVGLDCTPRCREAAEAGATTAREDSASAEGAVLAVGAEAAAWVAAEGWSRSPTR